MNLTNQNKLSAEGITSSEWRSSLIMNQSAVQRSFVISKQKAYYLGQWHMFFVILILFLCSVTGFFVMWFTDMYNNSIISSLVLSKNSTAVKWWTTPPLDPELRIHIFNYTNADRYMRGLDAKLKVEDLGPYTYIEKFEKVNVTFNGNYTISYRENRTYEFAPEKSGGRQYDKIMVPNIAFLIASAYLRHQNRFTQMGANMFLSGSRAFKKLTAHEFIWGYKEPILELKNKFNLGDSNMPKDDIFGMLRTIVSSVGKTICPRETRT